MAVTDSKINDIINELNNLGSYSCESHVITVSPDSAEVWVYENVDGRDALVAYSSMDIDRSSSIKEFIDDFFVLSKI